MHVFCILVATGFHRESTHEELVAKYGEDIVKNEEIVMHVSTDDSSNGKNWTVTKWRRLHYQ